MKKKLFTIFTFCFMAMVFLFSSGCSILGDNSGNQSVVGGSGQPEYYIDVTGDPSLETFLDGQIIAVVYKDGVKTDEKVEFISQDESLLKIDQTGKMIAQNQPGKVGVEVRHASGASSVFYVGILHYGKLPKFYSTNVDSNGEISVTMGESSNLGMQFTYSGMSQNITFDDAVFTCELNTEDYITVDETTGAITTKAVGETIVSVTASWRGFVKTVEIKVIVNEN